MTKSRCFLTSLIVFVTLVTVCISCNNDDDQAAEINMQTYIIGKWQSIKLVVDDCDKETKEKITEGSSYSNTFVEMSFDTHGHLAMCFWKNSGDRLEKYKTDVYNYIITDEKIKIFDKEGINVLNLTINKRTKRLYTPTEQNINGKDILIYMYFEKIASY